MRKQVVKLKKYYHEKFREGLIKQGLVFVNSHNKLPKVKDLRISRALLLTYFPSYFDYCEILRARLRQKKRYFCRNCGKRLDINRFFCTNSCAEEFAERYTSTYGSVLPEGKLEKGRIMFETCVDCQRPCKQFRWPDTQVAFICYMKETKNGN
ncbi:MAG: hypothetical protein NC828_03080 [Candidatus Omnitrophica bacterium]|nr:hypothetical protein [Candidatus Omnitrophota bacterium]